MGNTEIVLLDCQFILDNNKNYIIKEMAYKFHNSEKYKHYIFRSPLNLNSIPKKVRQQNYFIYKNINGLHWKDGSVDYSKLRDILWGIKENKIYVRGLEKIKVLKRYNTDLDIIDLDMDESLKNYDDILLCTHHNYKKQSRCALNNIFKLELYLNKSLSK